MTADRHAGYYHTAYGIGYLPTALKLHGISATLLDHTDSIVHRLVIVDLIRTERHIYHNQRMLRSADYALGEEDHLIHGDRQGILVATDDVRGAVANEEHLYARLVRQLRQRVVIRGEHRYLIHAFHPPDARGGHSCILYVY